MSSLDKPKAEGVIKVREPPPEAKREVVFHRGLIIKTEPMSNSRFKPMAFVKPTEPEAIQENKPMSKPVSVPSTKPVPVPRVMPQPVATPCLTCQCPLLPERQCPLLAAC